MSTRRLYLDKSKVGRIDVDRKELMSVRCKKIIEYEFTTDEGDVLTGTFKVTIRT